MSGYPSLGRYEALYAPYLGGRSDEAMMAGMGDLRGARVLELCAGGCRMTRAALSAGAESAMVVDACKDMLPSPLPKGAGAFVGTVSSFLFQAVPQGLVFDAAVCRQGVNYWFSRGMAGELAKILKPGGRFVFNTFNRRPDTEPRVVRREAGGVVFTEISWLDGGMVRHVQAAPGMEPHTTSFRWVEPSEYREALVGWFDAEEDVSGPTSVWTCVKR